MTDRELALRRRIFEAFAATGAPPPDVVAAPGGADAETLRALAARHVVVLDEDGRVRMAHPFAAHHERARVTSGARTWWGNCAWDGLGIVAALGLDDADVTADGVTLHVRGGELLEPETRLHVAVPARHWWDDIGFT